jgi:hypothetical protein
VASCDIAFAPLQWLITEQVCFQPPEMDNRFKTTE